MNRVTLLYPKVKVTIGGTELAATEIILRAAINEYPYAHVSTQQRREKGDDVSDVGQKELLEELGKVQTSMFDRRQPDSELEITMEAGEGGNPMEGEQKLSFKGLSTQTAMYYSQYGATRDDAIVPEYAEMDTLDLSIYDPAPLFEDADDAAMFPEFKGKILEYMGESFNAVMDPERLREEVQSDSSYSIPKDIVTYRNQQHALNEAVKHHYLTLLENSKETFNWDDLPDFLRWTTSEAEGYGREIPTIIASAYNGQGHSWLSNMVTVIDQFHCYYRPHWDNVGEFVCWDKAKDDPEEITLFPISISVRAGTDGIFSPKYLVVSDGATLQGASNNLHIDSTCQPYVYAYPKEQVKEGSSGYKIPLPPWWPQDALKATDINDGVEEEDDPGIEDIPDNIPDEAAKIIEKNYENREKIVNLWARCAYQRYALSACAANLILPPTLNLQVGQYYKVKSPEKDGGGGDIMFEGVLQSVEHRIKLSSQEGQAFTAAYFTRVRFPGFKLPGE